MPTGDEQSAKKTPRLSRNTTLCPVSDGLVFIALTTSFFG
jgi:hypothetical protein